jgi:hypothetical protein
MTTLSDFDRKEGRRIMHSAHEEHRRASLMKGGPQAAVTPLLEVRRMDLLSFLYLLL